MLSGFPSGDTSNMSEHAAESKKQCAGCGEDVTSKPRVKDAKGNYFCKACAAKKQAELSKKVGKSAGAAAGAAAGGGDPDVMAKLIDDSLAKGANSCPACRRPWKAGAVVCTHCGFNKETGQMVGTQIKAPDIVKGPKVVGGKGGKRRGGKKFVGAHWKIAVVLIAIYGGGFVFAMMSPEFAPIFGLGVSLFGFLFGVFAALDAYMESDSILKAILVFICGIYAVYYCCVETGNDLLKGAGWAYVLIFLLYMAAIAMGVVALGAAGALDPSVMDPSLVDPSVVEPAGGG
jgi:hypothetical protein